MKRLLVLLPLLLTPAAQAGNLGLQVAAMRYAFSDSNGNTVISGNWT